MIATKAEAQKALNAARTKAQNAHKTWDETSGFIEREAAEMYYQRCVRELEEAINEMARFEVGDE